MVMLSQPPTTPGQPTWGEATAPSQQRCAGVRTHGNKANKAGFRGMPEGTEPSSAPGSSPTTAVHLSIIFTPKPFRTHPHPMACSCATTGLTCKQTNTQPSSVCLLLSCFLAAVSIHVILKLHAQLSPGQHHSVGCKSGR